MMVMMECHLPSNFGRLAVPTLPQVHPLLNPASFQHRSCKKSFTIDSILQPEPSYSSHCRRSSSELQGSINGPNTYGLNQFCHFKTKLTGVLQHESGLKFCKTQRESVNFGIADSTTESVIPASMSVPVPVYLRHGKTTYNSLKSKKCRRSRTVFTEAQLKGLENIFEQQKYLSTSDRLELADRLGLSQLQIKTWYQNRRMKWKKQVLESGETESPTKPKGRPRRTQENRGEPISFHETNPSVINTN